jgi:hypothetical protein
MRVAGITRALATPRSKQELTNRERKISWKGRCEHEWSAQHGPSREKKEQTGIREGERETQAPHRASPNCKSRDRCQICMQSVLTNPICAHCHLHLPYMVIICCHPQSHDDSQRRGVPRKQTPLSFNMRGCLTCLQFYTLHSHH